MSQEFRPSDENDVAQRRESEEGSCSGAVSLAAPGSDRDSQVASIGNHSDRAMRALEATTTSTGYHQSIPGYNPVPLEFSNSENDLGAAERGVRLEGDMYESASETDPLYPPAPRGYYMRHEPIRITNIGRLICVLFSVAVACLGIAAIIDVSTPPPGGVEAGRTEREVADSVLGAMDRSADPCENFYEYACGSWLRANKIPGDRSAYQKSFSGVNDRILLEIKDLLEGKLQRDGSRAGIFYAACLDQAALGGLKTAVLYKFRFAVSDISSPDAFAYALGVLHANSSKGLFSPYVGVDEGSPSRYAFYLSQGGLGLPHKDDYSSKSENSVKLRAVYAKEIETMLSAAGKARLIPRFGHDSLAARVLEFETELAKATLLPASLRDPFKVYNKRQVRDLPSAMSFRAYLRGAGIDEESLNSIVVLESPEYFEAVGRIMARVENDVEWQRTARAYLVFHLVRSLATIGALGEQLYHAHFAFLKEAYGIQKLEPRWKMCQRRTTEFLPDSISKAYISHYFSNSRAQVASRLAQETIRAFHEKLDKQTWMDSETRAAAKHKLEAVGVKIGSTSKFDTYDDVDVTRYTYADNVASAMSHKWRRQITRLNHGVDKTEWLMNAHEVNAYYSPPRNEIVIPAGILQQPFFSNSFPAAMNYGGMGAIMGHELSHGEDDAGRKYDSTGLLRQWWTAKAAAEYDKRAKCYIDLYDSFKPRELSIHVLGNLTLGENLADINGLLVAYRAFRNYASREDSEASENSRVRKSTEIARREDDPPPNKVLARELSNNQLFFVAFAQNYCTLVHEEALSVWMKTDPHSPGRFRVLGAVSQNPEFAKAFQCKEGSKYNPKSRCDLWV